MRFALQNAAVGIWDMDLTTGAIRWSEILEIQYRLAARNIWRELRRVHRPRASRRSGVRARGDGEGDDVWRRFLDPEPIDLA